MIDSDILYLRDECTRIRVEILKHLPCDDDIDKHLQLKRALDHMRDVEALLHQACGSTA